MTSAQAEANVTRLLKPLYAYLRKRCATHEDAEDLTQDIALRLLRVLPLREDITNVDSFCRTVAHHALANYYRSKAKSGYGAMPQDIHADFDVQAEVERRQTEQRLRQEIAYLSKTRRQVLVLFYYENMKQQIIADKLGISLAMVKWHLSEAKIELKRGMNTMKTNHQLLFNPITFETISCNGSTGSMGHNKNYLRSALSQNIVYAVYREALTVNQIADTLGVSPVYVESEVAFLTENCFLLQKGQTYLSNCLIDEPTNELRRLHDELYTQAAALLAPELFDTLNANVQLGQNGIICPRNNLNFALWALIPYVLARGDAEAIPHTISFDEVATMRPDGGHNICGCSVLSPNVEPPLYWESLKRMGGPSWNGNAELLLWLIDTEWSERRIDYGTMMQQDYLLLKRFFADGELSCDETTHLVSRGYLKHEPVANGYCNSMQIVWIKGQEANQRILGYGSAIKDKHRNALNKLATPFVNAILDETPPHLRKMQAYGLQHILHSDGWFIMHCLKYLVGAGKLKLPIDDERRSLTAVVVTEK